MHHELRTEIEIDATPETMWSILTDLDRYCEWNPFVVASGTIAVGAKLSNRMQPPEGRAMTIKPAVTVVEPDQIFEWLGHFGFSGVFDGRHRFELEALPAGGTRVLHSEKFQGVLVRLMRNTLDTQTKSGFEAMNAALKTQAEAAAGATS